MSAYVPNDKIQQMMNILPEYMKIKGYMCSGGHMMHCIHPDHEDVHPSMGMFQGRDGKMRLHCLDVDELLIFLMLWKFLIT